MHRILASNVCLLLCKKLTVKCSNVRLKLLFESQVAFPDKVTVLLNVLLGK